ncbi:MAG: hypothetical protein ACK6EB_07820, partial [Planctomyces sp.]
VQAAPDGSAVSIRRLLGRQLAVSQNDPPLTRDIITTLRDLNHRIAQLRQHLPRNDQIAELERWMEGCPESGILC